MEEKKNKFFSCKYENEPVDLKLLLIYFIKRIRFVIYFAIFGALIFASYYYLKTFVFVEERQYEASAELYLVYAEDVRLENVYINDYTWQTLVQTDRVTGYVMEMLGDPSVTEEYLHEAVWAGLVSDARFVSLKVTTEDPEKSVLIAQAYQSAIKKLGEEMIDIDTITVFTEADSAREIITDDRTLRMACTGAVIGIILSCLGIALQYIFDDSIYVANQFVRRFQIPVVGISVKTKKNELLEGNMVGHKSRINKNELWNRQVIKLNYSVLTAGCKKVVAVDTAVNNKNLFPFELLRDAKMKLEQDEILSIAMGNLKAEDAFYTSDEYDLRRLGSVNEEADLVLECAGADAVILMVQMGAHNEKLLERTMDLLTKHNCNVVGALLYDGDSALLRMYYFQPLPFGGKNDRTEYDDAYDDDFNLEDIF